MIHNANEKRYYNQEEPEDAYLIYALRLAGVGEKKLAQIKANIPGYYMERNTLKRIVNIIYGNIILLREN